MDVRSTAEAARLFLGSLTPTQRTVATYPFADVERYRWQYTPGGRGGLRLGAMTGEQPDLALRLVESGLSDHGAATARAIIGLEPVLRRIEEAVGRPGAERRDPGNYYVSVFGDPEGGGPWAWRLGGHHLCVHLTVVGTDVAVTPLFFGANPARVPDGEQQGFRALATEEDLGRDLVTRLEPDRRAHAVVSDEAPDDIRTGNAMRAEIARVPLGIGYRDLSPPQQEVLAALLRHYLGRAARPPEVDPTELAFAWAGSTEPGRPHYYAIRGGTFLVEYDNTQDDANHAHSVLRHLRDDFGGDALRAHVRRDHSAP